MRDAAVTFVIRVAGAGLALALQVLLARLMAPEDYGNYVIIWTWLLALGSFASLGLAESAVRFLPRYEVRGRHGMARAFFSFGFRATAVAAAAAALAAIVVLSVAPAAATVAPMGLFVALALPFLALEYFFEGVARALGWFRLTSVAVFIARPLVISLACLALYSAGVPLTAPTVAAVLIAVLAVTAAVLFGVLRQRLSAFGPAAATAVTQTHFWLRATIPMLLVSGLEDVVASADVLLVGWLLSPTEAGYYFAAGRILALAYFAQYAVQFVQGRRFSLALTGAAKREVERSIQQATRLTMLATLAATSITLMLGFFVLAAFGAAFTDAYVPMVILAAGLVARSLSVQAAELLLIGAKYLPLVLTNTVTIAAFAAGMLVLAPAFGLMGAAAAMALGQLLRSILLIACVKSSLGARVLRLSRVAPV